MANLVIGFVACLMRLRRIAMALTTAEVERRALVARRREGEDVDADMSAVFAEKNKLNSQNMTTLITMAKHITDLPLGYHIGELGTLDNNLVGASGTVSSILGLYLIL